MPKPHQRTELDEANRVIGMLKAVSDPKDYMKIFGITKEDIIRYRDIINERKISNKPIFSEEDNDEK